MAKDLSIITDPKSSGIDIVNAYCDLKNLEKQVQMTEPGAGTSSLLSKMDSAVDNYLSSLAPTVQNFSGGRQSLIGGDSWSSAAVSMLDICNSVYENDGKQFNFYQTDDGKPHIGCVGYASNDWLPNGDVEDPKNNNGGSYSAQGTTTGNISWGMRDWVTYIHEWATGSASAWLPYIEPQGNAQTAGDSTAVSSLAKSLTD
jgi:hypothetical protein